MRDNRRLIGVERALLVVGVACVAWYGYVTLEAAQYQRRQIANFEERLADAARPREALATRNTLPGDASSRATKAPTLAVLPSRPLGASTRTFSGRLPAHVGKMVGILDIPRLGLSTAVITGDDAKTLDVAAGHLPDTPHPWEPGNSAIAAHRDQLFRPLEKIRPGDTVRMRTLHGDLDYRVRDIRIVSPDDVSVLASTETSTLTLITCYPFRYVGAAPRRFIVRADRVDESETPGRGMGQTLRPVAPLRAAVHPRQPNVAPSPSAPAPVALQASASPQRQASPRRGPEKPRVSKADARQASTNAKPADEKPKAQPKRRWYRIFRL